MKDHISKVFIDGIYRDSGLAVKDLAASKKNFRENAMKVLEDTGADHAVYCHIEYNEDGEITGANFYSNLTMNDATFYERTRDIPGTDYVGSVHNMKIPYENCAKDLKNLAIKAHCYKAKLKVQSEAIDAWDSKTYSGEAYDNVMLAVDDSSRAYKEFSERITVFATKYGVTYGVARDMARGIAELCDLGIETQRQKEDTK